LSRFRDARTDFTEANTEILGVSTDSVWANKAFREHLGVEFPILSDAKGAVSRTYGIYNDDAGVSRRTTFVIDTAGIVRHIDQDRAALDPATALGMCRLIKR
jgi:peroxiredoxin